jgi:putative ABC transport system substrate-binding protein
MRRRSFLTLLGGAAAAWPLAARAQQRPAMLVVGVLGSDSPDLSEVRLRGFRQGLSETGYVEGRNVAIEYRWAENQADRLPALAADLVRRQVHVIVALGSAVGAQAARAATATIPIVFQTASDPVAVGLVASLNRPGGNLTGVTSLNIELGPKLLQVLHELVPTAGNLALLVNPTDVGAETQLRDAQAAARTLGLPQLHVLHASSEHDFDRAFAKLVQLRTGGLAIAASALFSGRSEQLAALAMRYEVATKVTPGAHAILILDQAGWHGAKDLKAPGNISLLPLPPRSPELNPQENIWQFMRTNWLSNRVFKSFDDIVDHCCYAWNTLIDQPWKIMSIARRDWALAGHSI